MTQAYGGRPSPQFTSPSAWPQAQPYGSSSYAAGSYGPAGAFGGPLSPSAPYPSPPQPGSVPPGRLSPSPSQPGPRPTPSRSPLRLVLLSLIVLTVLALGGLAAANLWGGAGEATTPYVNDDHKIPPPEANPPPLPNPASLEEAKQFTDANKIYQQKVPAPVRCEVPRMTFEGASDAALKSHFEDMMACLVRVWELPEKDAGYVIVRPTVTIYGDKVHTACGDAGINAMYCTLDQQVYYSRLVGSRVPLLGQDPWAADLIIAHEFGHAVQGRTGIFMGFYKQAINAKDKHEVLLLQRRVETQADCFSAMFARSVSKSIGIKQTDLERILNAYYAFGSDVLSGKPNIESDHGLGATRRYWGSTGLGADSIGTCNTFTAPASLVR